MRKLPVAGPTGQHAALRRRILKGGLCSLAALAVPASARAADELSNRRLIVDRLAEYESFGWHWSGSDAERLSSDWLARLMSINGITVEVEKYPFDRLDVETCTVNAGPHRVPGLPLFDSGATGADGVTGALGLPGEDVDIAVLEATVAGGYEDALAKARAHARHKAIIVVTLGPHAGLLPLDMQGSHLQTMPVVQVSGEHRDWLRDAVGKKSEARVLSRFGRTPVEGHNVIGAIAGTQTSLAPLVVVVPFTGWGPCVGELGGSIIAWLQSADFIASTRPERAVVFVAVSGSELDNIGLRAFNARYPELRSKAHGWMFLGRNLGARGSSVVIQSSDEAWTKIATDRLAIEHVAIQSNDDSSKLTQKMLEGGTARFLSLAAPPAIQFHHPADQLPIAITLDQVVALGYGASHTTLEIVHGLGSPPVRPGSPQG